MGGGQNKNSFTDANKTGYEMQNTKGQQLMNILKT